MNRVIQRRLLFVTGVFLALQALIISISPAVRMRSTEVDYRISHWIVLAMWALMVARVHHDLTRKLPDADPYLFPAAVFISGWGMMTIWRLDAGFGARQVFWFFISLATFSLGTRLQSIEFLRRYKYTLLTCGLTLAVFTLVFGKNPSGNGPRLWIGYGDLYLQPSEPLKLLLVIFLAAYLADRLPARLRTIHILYPTIILSGIVILMLVLQRDLGTAAIFTALYTIIIYLAIGRKRILLISIIVLAFVSITGYYFVGIIQTRFDSWLNPWADPAGKSYQIIQSIIAIANGGIIGTGPGLGRPGYIPVAISDFIYAAIAEETGLIGTLGLLAIISLIIARGLRASLRAPDLFRRFLAAGICAYLGIQTILIVGGNLRILPLTGVTLPFVSYGGSSLLTSFISLLLLLYISSNQLEAEPAPLSKPQPYLILGGLLSLGLFAAALVNGWWSVIRGPDLLTRPDNLRRLIAQQYVPRGLLLDNASTLINGNRGEIGSYAREYHYIDLSPVTGYTDPKYGQAGLEAALDPYLSGTTGTTTSALIWDNLLYGTNPPGLNVRLSIDLYLQNRADELMTDKQGAVILMNAQSGEILVMSSHPGFDPNQLAKSGEALLKDPGKPLLNRAAQGQYPPGAILQPLVQAVYGDEAITNERLGKVLNTFGFFQTPQIQLPVADAPRLDEVGQLQVSPLQMALAASALSNRGIVPAARIAMAVNTPSEGWVSLPALGKPFEAIQESAGHEAILSYLVDGQAYWQHIALTREKGSSFTWFIGGTAPDWQAAPLAIVVVLEEENEQLARRIGSEILIDAMNP